MKWMITSLRNIDCWIDSPCQFQRKCIDKSMENMDADLRVQRVNEDCSIFNKKGTAWRHWFSTLVDSLLRELFSFFFIVGLCWARSKILWGTLNTGLESRKIGQVKFFSEIINMETLLYGISLYFGLNFLSHFRKKAETSNLFLKSRS